MFDSSLSHLAIEFGGHSLVLGFDLTEEVDFLNLGVLLSLEGGLGVVVGTAGLVGVEFLGSMLGLADAKLLVLLVDGDLEVSDGGDFSFSVSSEDDFFLLCQDLPVSKGC